MSMTLKRLTEGRRVCKGVLLSRILIFFIYSIISYQITFFFFL